MTWRTSVADPRLHGTTFERLTPFVRDIRRVARDGFVQIHGSHYGVPWAHARQHGQWEQLRSSTPKPVETAVVRQVPTIDVERRSLRHYEHVAAGGLA